VELANERLTVLAPSECGGKETPTNPGMAATLLDGSPVANNIQSRK